MSSKKQNNKNYAIKSSKISALQKMHLVNAIQTDGLNIKVAADKIGINYSSAKLIYKKYKADLQAERVTKNKRQNQDLPVYKVQQYEKNIQCYYRQIQQKDKCEASNSTEQIKKKPITIISTIAWDFMNFGSPDILILDENK